MIDAGNYPRGHQGFTVCVCVCVCVWFRVCGCLCGFVCVHLICDLVSGGIIFHNQQIFSYYHIPHHSYTNTHTNTHTYTHTNTHTNTHSNKNIDLCFRQICMTFSTEKNINDMAPKIKDFRDLQSTSGITITILKLSFMHGTSKKSTMTVLFLWFVNRQTKVLQLKGWFSVGYYMPIEASIEFTKPV